MGSFGSYYKGDRKKLKKSLLEKRARKVSSGSTWQVPQVEIVKKGKKDW